MRAPTLIVVIGSMLLLSPLPAAAATISPVVNNLGLVGYWSFNDGSGTVATDFSGGGNTGTLTSGTGLPAWASGKHGDALSFDGGGGYVNTTSASALDLTGSMTVGAWVKAGTNVTNYRMIISKESTAGPPWPYRLYLEQSTGRVIFDFTISSSIHTFTSTTAINDNAWHHVVAVRDNSAKTVTIYIDGVPNTPTAYTGTPDSGAQKTRIGISPYTGQGAGGSYPFVGTIDDVRLYNRALTAAEVSNLYHAGETPVRAANNLGLVGAWNFDDGSGTQAGDSSGNGNSGTLSGTTLPTWVAGKHGDALSFDGSTGYVRVPDPGVGSLFDFTTSMTVVAWVNLSSASSYPSVVTKGDSLSWGWLFQFCGSTRQIGLYLQGPHSSWSECGNTAVPLNTWTQIAATYDGSNIYYYLNGAADGSVGATGSISTNNDDVSIGRRSDGYYFPGKIDDVRIYGRALSADEVRALYETGATQVNANTAHGSLDEGLVGYWPFAGKDIHGTTVYDESGQANHLTASGSPTPAIGKIGQGLSFNGSSSYMRRSSLASSLGSSMTICMWLNTSYSAGSQFLWSIDRNPSSIVNEGILYLVGGKLRYWDYTGSSYGFADNTPDSTATVNDGVWHLACFVKSGTAGTYYVDGAASGTKTASTNVSYGSTDMILGSNYRDSNSYLNGSLDEVRLYSRALSAAEIQTLYNAGR